VVEKTRTDADGTVAKGWDHDPPVSRKWVPLGILILVTGALTIVFGNRETSDFWVDGLRVWWLQVKGKLTAIRRLVIYLDNGPKNVHKRIGVVAAAAGQVVDSTEPLRQYVGDHAGTAPGDGEDVAVVVPGDGLVFPAAGDRTRQHSRADKFEVVVACASLKVREAQEGVSADSP